MDEQLNDAFKVGDRVTFRDVQVAGRGIITEVLRHGYVRVRWSDWTQEIMHHNASLAPSIHCAASR